MNILAQTNALADAEACCCPVMPCLPTCSDACEEEEDEEPQTQVDVELDVTKDVMDEVKPIGDDVIEESGVTDALEDVVTQEEASQIVDEILTPIIDDAIAVNVLPVDEIIDTIEEVVPDENQELVDPLPDVEAVVEVIEDEIIPDHPEVTVEEKTDIEFTEEQKDNATVVEIVDDEGNAVEVVVIEVEPEVTPAVPEVVDTDVDTEIVDVVDTEEAEVVDVEEPADETETAVEEVVEEEVVEEEVVEEETATEEVVEEEVVEEEVEEETTSTKKEVVVYETAVEELEAGEDALAQLLSDANGRPVILDFQYDACAPCQEIAPEFEAIMEKYPDAVFKNVDIYQHRDLLMELGVTATPTFKLWVNGEFDSTLAGASGFEELDGLVGTLVEEY